MIVLGFIVAVVGIALILVGRITAHSLPSDYDASTGDGFEDLLGSVGKLLAGIGIFFLVAGAVILLMAIM